MRAHVQAARLLYYITLLTARSKAARRRRRRRQVSRTQVAQVEAFGRRLVEINLVARASRDKSANESSRFDECSYAKCSTRCEVPVRIKAAHRYFAAIFVPSLGKIGRRSSRAQQAHNVNLAGATQANSLGSRFSHLRARSPAPAHLAALMIMKRARIGFYTLSALCLPCKRLPVDANACTRSDTHVSQCCFSAQTTSSSSTLANED